MQLSGLCKTAGFAALLIILLLSNTAAAQFKQNRNLKFRQEEKEQQKPKRKSPKGAMLRSALLPGWGQIYNGKYLKSVVYFGFSYYFLNEYVKYDKKLKGLTEQNDIDFYTDKRNVNGWRFAAAYFLNIGDAFVDAHLFGFEDDSDISVSLRRYPQDRGMMLNVRLSF